MKQNLINTLRLVDYRDATMSSFVGKNHLIEIRYPSLLP